MKIGLVQYSPVWESKPENKLQIIRMIGNQSSDFSLLIFPEMTLTGFTMEAEKFSEPINGESFKFFSELAKKYSLSVICGIIEKNKEKYYNTLLHINKEGITTDYYRKIHPFSYSGEDKYYARGDRPSVTKINGWKTGLSVCYDLRFPELFRQYARSRAELIINIANWPDTRSEHWRTLLKARAIENQCYVAGVNRVGDDPKLHYDGYSSVFDPTGKEIAAVANEKMIIPVVLDLNLVTDVRTKLPFLNDMHLI